MNRKAYAAAACFGLSMQYCSPSTIRSTADKCPAVFPLRSLYHLKARNSSTRAAGIVGSGCSEVRIS